MSDNFLQTITEDLLADRLGKELQKNERYKAAVAEEERLFNLLNSSMNEEQQKLFKEYFEAVSTTASCVEELAYKQGMKDLQSLYRSLEADAKGCAS